MSIQVVLHAGPRQCGVSDYDGPAGGDGVRHRSLKTAAVRLNRQKPGKQKPSQTAAQEVRRSKSLADRRTVGWAARADRMTDTR